ncbi:hypothetical protein MTP99_014508 [Tenebrio molitor]|nr:hypothetical protein MTP99_014508 [Tenebrio molitor]
MFFFETTCISRDGTQSALSSHSGVEEASCQKSTPIPKMDSTVRPLQRVRGNTFYIMYFSITNLFGYGVFGGVVLQLFYPNAYATSNTVKYKCACAQY